MFYCGYNLIYFLYQITYHLYLYDENKNKLRKRNRSYLFNAIIILKNGIKLPSYAL